MVQHEEDPQGIKVKEEPKDDPQVEPQEEQPWRRSMRLFGCTWKCQFMGKQCAHPVVPP